MEEDKVKRWKQRTNWSDSSKPSVSTEDNMVHKDNTKFAVLQLQITEEKKYSIFGTNTSTWVMVMLAGVSRGK